MTDHATWTASGRPPRLLPRRRPSTVDPRARSAWALAAALMAVSLVELVDVFPHGRITGPLRTVIEIWVEIDMIGLITTPLTVSFTAFVLIRHWRMGWVRWFVLLALLLVRVWSALATLRALGSLGYHSG